MNKLLFFAIFLLSGFMSYAQTCTVTGTSPLNWPTNGGGIVCAEGGNAVGKSRLIIPSGMTVLFGNGDTWTGTTMEIYGTLDITFDVLINSSLIVGNGGLLNLGKKLDLGTAAGCPYQLVVYTGGVVTVEDTGADRLVICGEDIMRGNGSCNDCGGTNSGQCPYDGRPYCEPATGFTGPTGFTEDGYVATLPVELQYFTATPKDGAIQLRWATTMEENFYKFMVQRSGDGLTFEDIGEIQGQGFDIDNIVSKYFFEDEAPLVGYNYYRLKIIDLDNTFTYSDLTSVRINTSKKMAVYPNPSSGEMISFRTNHAPEESDIVSVTDHMGVEVFRAPATALQNSISFEDALRPGIYILRYKTKDAEQVSRIVVRN